MALSTFSKQPSPYPSLAFHLIRLGQVLSSIIVTSVLGFFIHHLSVELYYVPWTFILLISVSVFTLLSFIATSVLHHQRTLKPKTNAWINTFLSVLWMLGFALLAWNLSGLLSHQYGDPPLTSISFRVSTFLALVLDILMHRQTSHRGSYNPMQDHKPISHPIFSDNPTQPRTAYREPSLEFPEYSHEVKKPYRVQKPIEVQHFGYTAPTEQTSYDGAAADQGDLGLSKGMHNGYGNGGFV
ncbi:hypothetical protein MMC13_007092 [Lambiella insularis]|nr:hypothetical protein [Lambiella insularis]